MNSVLILIVFAGTCSAVPKYKVPVPIPMMPDLDLKKLTGKWFPIATVQYDKQTREVYGYLMEPKQNGELVLKIDVPKNGDCRRKKVVLYPIKRAEFDTEDEKTTVRIVDTDYETYHIIHFLMEHMGMLQLYGREQTVADEVKEKFKTLATDLQFDPDAIAYVSENNLCI
ncbi:major urinary protein-like [Podarcis raffonei]|uniref:major urinary protein-like n=1 Tax=Podarcis raffonei TaxID=65483 RepID=UPI0023299033|nr:major urinary protein-like [Podarcis raffonei]XP_053227771.1 major urinary protein-like [Podarcis raffonei]